MSAAEVAAVKTLLTERLTDRVGKVADWQISERIVQRLKGAPLSYLNDRITKRLKAVGTYGFVLYLADDAVDLWTYDVERRRKAEEQQQKRAQAPAPNIAAEWHELTDEQREALRHLPEFAQLPVN